MITVFENFSDNKLQKEFISLFYRKICEYGNVVGKNYLDNGNYEIEFIEDNELYLFYIIINRELELSIKSSFHNDSIFYNKLGEYFLSSVLFQKIDQSKYRQGVRIEKYKILGTPQEVEDDLEMMIQANKYNL